MSPSLFMGYLNCLSLDRQFSQYIYKVFLDGFVILDGLREGNVYHFIVVNAYHDIALSFHDGVDGGCAQTAGKDTVVCRRATAALQVTEDGYAYVILGGIRSLHALHSALHRRSVHSRLPVRYCCSWISGNRS